MIVKETNNEDLKDLTYTISTFRQLPSDLIDYYHSLDVNSERLTCPDVHY